MKTNIIWQAFKVKKALEGIENYANTDMATQYQWQLFAEAGLGVRYTYIGSISKKSINIDIPNHRLKELLKERDE